MARNVWRETGTRWVRERKQGVKRASQSETLGMAPAPPSSSAARRRTRPQRLKEWSNYMLHMEWIYGKGNIILKQSTMINHGADECPPKGACFVQRAMSWAIGGFMSTYISPGCADLELIACLKKADGNDGL
jgi:hypothetical protein